MKYVTFRASKFYSENLFHLPFINLPLRTRNIGGIRVYIVNCKELVYKAPFFT